MASVTGTYKGSNIKDIADAMTLIDDQLDIEGDKISAISGVATAITGTLTLFVGAENVDNERYNHKITTTINCPDLLSVKTLADHLGIFATEVETESDYTTVVAVDVLMSTTFSN